jgi:hypothetical protein
LAIVYGAELGGAWPVMALETATMSARDRAPHGRQQRADQRDRAEGVHGHQPQVLLRLGLGHRPAPARRPGVADEDVDLAQFGPHRLGHRAHGPVVADHRLVGGRPSACRPDRADHLGGRWSSRR